MNNEETVTAEQAWNMSIESCKEIIDKINSKILEAVKEHKLSVNYYWKDDPVCSELSNSDIKECVEEYFISKGFTIYIDTYLKRNCVDISWKKH